MLICIICISLISSKDSHIKHVQLEGPKYLISHNYKMVNCVHVGMHVVSSNTQPGCDIQTMLD